MYMYIIVRCLYSTGMSAHNCIVLYNQVNQCSVCVCVCMCINVYVYASVCVCMYVCMHMQASAKWLLASYIIRQVVLPAATSTYAMLHK